MPSRNVKVRAFSEAGGIGFEVDGIKAKHSRMQLPRDSGEHSITFRLQDQSGQALRFDTGDPIWIDEDGPCPPTPGISSDQLSVVGCTNDVLSTVNANSGRARALRYQLNFIRADGSRVPCDPIIDNGGGTTS